MDDIIGLCSDNEMEDSVEEESKRNAYDELEIGRIIRKRTEPILYSGPRSRNLEINRDSARKMTSGKNLL